MTSDMMRDLEDMKFDVNIEQFQLFDEDSSLQLFWKQAVPGGKRWLIDSLLRETDQMLQEIPDHLRMELEREVRQDVERRKLAPPELVAPPQVPQQNRDVFVVPPAPRSAHPSSKKDSLREI